MVNKDIPYSDQLRVLDHDAERLQFELEFLTRWVKDDYLKQSLDDVEKLRRSLRSARQSLLRKEENTHYDL